MRSDELFTELYDLTDELLASNQNIKLRVGGGSMYPFLKNGDIVTFSKCKAAELKIGDVVIFKSSAKWIAHRLIKTGTQAGKIILITKGDTCKHKDPPFTEDDLVGKVIVFSRNGNEKSLENSNSKRKGLIIARFYRILTPFYLIRFRLMLLLQKSATVLNEIVKSVLFICSNSRRLTYINLVISIVQGILPFMIIYLVKGLIDSITNINSYPAGYREDAFRTLLLIITATGLAFLASSILSIFGGEYKERLSQSISRYIYSLLHQKHISLDMAYTEDASQQDKIHRAVQEAGFRPVKIVTEGLMVVQSLVSWLFIAVMLLTIHWAVFLLIVIAVLPGIWVRFRFAGKLYRLNKSNSPKERKAYYYNRIITGMPFAKEVRLFGTGGFFTNRFDEIQDDLHHEKNQVLHKRAIVEVIAQTFAVLITFLSFGLVSFMAIRGLLSTGTVVLFFLIFQRGFTVLKELFQSVVGIYEDHVFLRDFFDFLQLPSLRKLPGTSKIMGTLKKGIFIENMSFHYPASQRNALESVSIEIPAGKTVALVGANGSGKSTLVKLLCGFYTPSSGRILFDDVDISTISPEEIRKQITAVFQDFALYNMTAKENIALGDIMSPIDNAKVEQAARNANIDEILKQLPGGYDNMLGTLFEHGEELSIGQWQKIAIARAFYRNLPVLFMDEPSSALDAETELNLLQNLKSLAKEKTVIIISHRFSTIKWADIIYVLENGKVAEYGSHEQLVKNRKQYHTMYELNRNL